MTKPIEPAKTQFRNNGYVYTDMQKPMDKTGLRDVFDPTTAKDPLDNFDKLVKKHR